MSSSPSSGGRRGQGIDTTPPATAVQWAGAIGWTRLTVRTSHRSTAVCTVAERFGAVAVDAGRGQVEVLFDVNTLVGRISA